MESLPHFGLSQNARWVSQSWYAARENGEMRRVTDDERRARLAKRHHLAAASRAAGVADVARDLVGLHATDPASIYLGAAARLKKPSTAVVESALYDEHTVVRMLGMRRTLFVEPLDLTPVVQAAASDAVAKRERTRLMKFLQEGGISEEPAKWLKKAEKAAHDSLAKRGEATAAEVGKDAPILQAKLVLSRGKKYEAEVGVAGRVLLLLAAEGKVIRGRPRGSWISTQYKWAATETWLGKPIAKIPVDEARAELVRHWLHAFGPGTVEDIKWWTGWTLGETKKALADVEPVEVALDNGGGGLLLADDLAVVRSPKPWIALLPSLDPTVMGWKERSWYLGDYSKMLFDTMGNAGPTVWCNGRIVGGWAQRKNGEIAVRLLEDVGKAASADVDAAAERLAELIGDVRFTPRFPAPLDRELRA